MKSYGFSDAAVATITSNHKRLDFDSFVTISRDGISAPFGATAANLRDMHWGKTRCDGPVDRSAWPANHTELALVYCAEGQCVAIPRTCGNVSRIDFAAKYRAEPEIRPEYDPYIPRDINTVPEPSSIALVALALLAAAFISRRTR